MPVRIDPTNPREIVVPLPVRYQSNDINNAVPELEAYLKGRYPEVQQVHIRLSVPAAGPLRHSDKILAQSLMLLLPTVKVLLAIGLANNPFTRKIVEDIADDAYKWLKKRFKVKKRPRKRKRRTRG